MVETPSQNIRLGSTAPDFSLPNFNPEHGGETVGLSDFTDSKALLVVFICNHCPYVVHIAKVLAQVVSQYQARGVGMVAINANDVDAYPQDSPDKMTAMSEQYGFTFPYLYDDSQKVAVDYGAVCTPDLFLFDADNRLAYHGQFDDARPGNNRPVTGADLSAAIESLLRGEVVDTAQTPSVGCNIKWKPGIEV